MDDVTLARAVHVLTIVHWIGGMAFVTLVILPMARRAADPSRAWGFSKRSSSAFPRRSGSRCRWRA